MVNLNGYYFEEGFSLSGTDFNEVAGIYIIYTQSGRVLDVGQTSALKTRLTSHERKILWILKAGVERLFVAFHTEGNFEQRTIKERILRISLNPLCGEK